MTNYDYIFTYLYIYRKIYISLTIYRFIILYTTYTYIYTRKGYQKGKEEELSTGEQITAVTCVVIGSRGLIMGMICPVMPSENTHARKRA